MTRVIGPMHSDDASGLYGGRKTGIVFSKWGLVRYTRQLAVDPANPRTPAQLPNRAVVYVLNELWKTFSDIAKQDWADYGAQWSLPGWQACCKYNLQQARAGWMPQPAPNTEHVGAPDPPTAFSAAVVENLLHAEWTDNAISFCSAVHLGTAPAFTPSMANLAFACLATDGLVRECTFSVAPGTYYLCARSSAEDGGAGAATAVSGPHVIE